MTSSTTARSVVHAILASAVRSGIAARSTPTVIIDKGYFRRAASTHSHAAASSYRFSLGLAARTAESMICSRRLLWAPCQYTWAQVRQRENVW